MSGRGTALDAHAAGLIDDASVDEALACVGGTTGSSDYQQLARVFLLAAGLLSIAIGIGFFIAFNWAELGRFGKFALVVAAIAAATGIYALAARDSAVSQVSQVVIVLLLGTLLALSGQIYQTGADRWQLFATWALVTLPFAVITRNFWVWLVWLVVADFAAVLYASSVGWGLFWLWFDERAAYWSLAIFNALFALLLTLLPALLPAERWRTLIVQVAVITLGTCTTLLAIYAIISAKASGLPGFLAWLVSMGMIYYEYRVRRINLVLLSGFALSMIAVIVTLFIRVLEAVSARINEGWLLLIALLILGLATAAGRWLYRLQQLDERAS